MHSHAEEMKKEVRINRFYLAALKCIDKEDKPFPSCVVCGHRKGIAGSLILDSCGHVLCLKCETDDRGEECPKEGCDALAMRHNLVWASTLGHKDVVEPEFWSSKAQNVAALCYQIIIRSHNQRLGMIGGDRILIFVQYELLRDAVIQRFEQNGIDFLDATRPYGDTSAEYKISAFAEGTRRRILFLPLDNVNAAGWNLQIANHIIFLAPFVTNTQHEYDSVMKQAIGRALRPGQTRDVHVYYFMHLNTIEVNILQDRNKKWLVQGQEKGDDEWYLKDYKDFATGEEPGYSGHGLDGMQDWTQKQSHKIRQAEIDKLYDEWDANPDSFVSLGDSEDSGSVSDESSSMDESSSEFESDADESSGEHSSKVSDSWVTDDDEEGEAGVGEADGEADDTVEGVENAKGAKKGEELGSGRKEAKDEGSEQGEESNDNEEDKDDTGEEKEEEDDGNGDDMGEESSDMADKESSDEEGEVEA